MSPPRRAAWAVGRRPTAAAGKDVGAADEVAVEVAPDHKNFVTMSPSRRAKTVAAGRGEAFVP